MTQRLTAAVTREGKHFVARCLEVEVASHGRTLDSALANLTEAVELYFEDENAVAPAPAPIIAPIEVAMPR